MIRRFRHLALALVAVLALGLAAQAAPASDTPDFAARKVRAIMGLVREGFLAPVPDAQLNKGAIEGLKKFLTEQKKDASFLGSATTFDNAFTAAGKRYPELLKDGSLTKAAIDGAVATLDDPYTTFLSASEYRKLLEGLGNGSFGGVGIYISTDEKTKELTCVEPMENGPAYRAGVKARDVITAIDGKSVSAMSLEDAKNALRGEVGSKVRLTLRREGAASPVEVTVTREEVRVQSVTARVENFDGHKVGYVRVRMFGTTTGKEVEAALDSLDKQGVEAYVVDLRNNGGGYITAAVDLLSQFLPAQKRLVSVAERGEPERVYNSRGNDRRQLPLALLVNDHSASASEITAGAIKDHRAGVLVGVKTYGKGSVQKIIPLQDLTALKLTTAHYKTPSGRDIHKLGIEPDVVVEMEPQAIGTDKDVQLSRALEIVVGKLAGTTAPAGR